MGREYNREDEIAGLVSEIAGFHRKHKDPDLAAEIERSFEHIIEDPIGVARANLYLVGEYGRYSDVVFLNSDGFVAAADNVRYEQCVSRLRDILVEIAG